MTNRHHMMVSILSVGESNRISYDEETEEYIGNVEVLSGDIADLTKTAKNPEGISLFRDKDKTEFKSTAELLRDISKIYGDLTDKQQAGLLEALAGKRQGQIIAAILNNFDAVESSLESMQNSAGSAMAEMNIVTESLTYKLNALKETGVGIAQNLFAREDMGVVVDGLTSILELVNKLTESAGLFGTIGIAGGIAGVFKLLSKDEKGISNATKLWGAFREIQKVTAIDGVAAGFDTIATKIGVSATALSGFIGVTAGIVGVVALVDALTTSFGEMTKKSEEARNAYKETQSSLESLNKELSENNIRRKELQNKDKLSINEQQELNNLERQNRLLENQIKLQERLAEIQGRSAATAANDVLSKSDSFGSLSLIDQYSARQNQLNSLNRQEEALSTRMQRYTPEDMADVSPFARNARQQAYQDDKTELERIQQESQELMQKMSEDATTMQENYASLFDSNGNIYEGCVDTVRKYNEAVLYSGTATEVAAQKQQTLSDIISEYVPKADQASFSMEKFTKSIGEEKLSDLQTQLAEAGLSLSDFEYSLSDVGDTIAHGDLKDGAEDAVKSLEKLSKFKDEVGIGSALTTTAEGDDYRKVLERNINQMNDLKLRPDVDTSDIENANKIIAYCESELQELDKPAILRVDTKGLSKGQKELVSLLNEFNQVSNQRDIEVSVGADTSESDAKLAELQGKIQDQSAELEIDAEVDTSSVDGIKSALQNNDFAVALDMNVDQLPDQTANGTVNWKDNYDKMPDQTANGTVNWKDNYTNTLSVSNQYRYIYWTNVSTNSPPSGGGNRANGSAHAYGTSYAGGYWGVGAGGRTLVGELGEEIVVDPHNATWHTVGEKGAEFVDLPKDAIVFNHLQSRSLLSNGYALGRGRTMANGSAYAGGTAYAKGGKKALEKFQNWFEKLFDWIEIRLERQTKKIERFTKRADLNIERGNYDKAASQYSSAITASLTQIGNESIASNRYQSKANSVLNQAVKRKLISKKAAKNIRKGVASGKLNISSYGKKMQEVIKDYQEFYNKAQDAKDAVDELRESIYKYIKSLKDLRDAQRDAKIDLAESLSTIAKGGSNATGAFAMSQLAARNELLLSQQIAYDENVTAIESDFAAQEDKAANSAGQKASKAYQKKNAKKRKYKGKKLSKKQLKAYRNAIKKAQGCIKAKTAIASGTLKTIRKYNPSLYVSFVSYNESLTTSEDIQKILEDTRLEAAVNYAETSAEIFQNMLDMTEAQNDQADSRINVLSKQADAATGFSAKNSLLNQAATYYSAIVDNDRELVDKLSSSVNSYVNSVSDMSGVTSKLKKLSKDNKTRKAVEGYIESAKSAANSNKEIPATIISKLAEYVSKGYVSMAFYQACYNYNMALTAYNEAQAQLEIDEATAALERAALGQQKFENVQQEFTNEQNTITADMDLLQAQQDLKTTRGLSLSSYDYGSLIGNSMRLQDSYTREISALNEVIADNLASGLWTTSSQEYIDATNAISDYRTKIQECAKDQEEYNNAIAQLPYDVLDKALARLDAIEKYYESILDLNEQLGRDSSEQDYTNQIDANLSKLADLESEANQAYRDWQKALSSSDKVYGGKTADEWETAYMGYKADVNSLQADIDKLRDALRDDVYWRSFERAHKATEKLSDTLNGLSNFIDDDMLFDSDHNLTDYGITKVALLAKQFEATRDEVGNYANDIKNLNNLYAQGMYTQEEYFDKQAELQRNLLSSASDMKGYINEIREMYKNIDQAELDALKKLVDSRNKALSAKKSYYDYDKTIKDKTKDIQELTAQIAALEGIGTAEAKASMARLQEQLVEAQEDLAETRRDHYFDLSSNALDEMQDILSEEFDEKWEKLGVSLEDMKQLLADAKTIQEDNAALVSKSLEKLLAFYGVSGIQTHFASGTRRVRSSLVGLSNEAGSELIVTKNGIISHFNPGDGVVPSTLTQRLYQMALGRMPINANAAFGAANVNQHYDNLINIEGNVDQSVIEELKRFSQDFLEQSYNYTTERIKKDFVRTGGTRRI